MTVFKKNMTEEMVIIDGKSEKTDSYSTQCQTAINSIYEMARQKNINFLK